MLSSLWAKADGWKSVAGIVLNVVAVGLAGTGHVAAAKFVGLFGAAVLGLGVGHKAVKAKTKKTEE